VDVACQLSFYRSLEHLQTTYVDAFLINAPDLTVTPMLNLLNVLLKLREQRLVRYTGLCNVATVEILSHLHKAVPGAIQIIQNPLHSPWDPEYKIHLYCRRNGIQYNTFHTLTSSDRIIQSDIMRSIATQRQIAPQTAFLQYCVQSDITPLVGARSQQNLLTALQVADGQLEPLSVDQLKTVSRLIAEQTVINRFRSIKLLQRERKKLKKERMTEKMRQNQERMFQDSLATFLGHEQRLVEIAKRRSGSFPNQLPAAVEERQEQTVGTQEQARAGIQNASEIDEDTKLGRASDETSGTTLFETKKHQVDGKVQGHLEIS